MQSRQTRTSAGQSAPSSSRCPAAAASETEVRSRALRPAAEGRFCNAPLAGYCTTNDDGNTVTYTVRTRAFAPDGGVAIDVRLTGADATRTAAAVCQRLTRHGAQDLAKGE
ncbi:hypothetical protein GCM10009753_48330 [Streptantibioticus ferralitis]